MRGVYIVTILFWPFSTGIGADKDQKLCGERKQTFEVTADDFEDAFHQVQLWLKGAKTNPHLWKAPIESIIYKQAGGAN